MKRHVASLIGGALAVILANGVAHARTVANLNQDHLLCYTMQDPLRISAAVSMFAVQPEFTQRNCKLRRPIEFCVPASKEVEQSNPAVTSVPGQPLQDDYICYSVDCPSQPLPPSKRVLDQFGRHRQQSYRPSKVCVPASKAVVPCGGLLGTNLCVGECTEPGQKCALLGGQCACGPAPCGGSPDAGGMCGGSCPGPGDVCHPSVADTGVVSCQCQRPGSPCGLNAAGMCGGDCTIAGAQCLPDATGACSCQTDTGGGTTPLCGQVAGVAPFTCGGICPTGSECQTVPGAAPSCGCLPKSCGTDAAGVCTGACADGSPCGPDPLNAGKCTCLPAPCGPVPGTTTCGGDCADTSQQCLPNAANECTCQSACGPDPTTNQCGGACPNPGDSCVAGAASPCVCTHVEPQCGFYGTASPQMCGGTCPPGKKCKTFQSPTVPNGLACGCRPA